jgi:hypothetical protein
MEAAKAQNWAVEPQEKETVNKWQLPQSSNSELITVRNGTPDA